MIVQRWWFLFRLVIALCVVGYSGYASWIYWNYSSLDAQVPFKKIRWSILERDEETFLYHVSYSYLVEDALYEHNEIFKKPVFINLLGAQHALSDFSKEYSAAWISSKNPSYSSLQKTFPVKELVSTAVLWLIFFYFVFLGKYYVYRYKSYHPEK